ncbi:F1892 protein, partial [Bombycilla garrulus]|nr:F1892 protein [Bombycilla garrulus]
NMFLSWVPVLTAVNFVLVFQVNLFALLSVISVMLNVSGLILGYQSAQFLSRVPRCDLMDVDEGKACLCCEELHPITCTEAEAVLKLHPLKSCRAAHLLLKKVVLALSALNAVTAAVCFIAAVLHCSQILASRRSRTGAIEDEDHNLDPDEFVPPVPPPSYFSALNVCTSQTRHRTPASDVIPLPHICVTRIRGVEVFCPLDPPPSYETVCSLRSSEQGRVLQINGMEDVDSGKLRGRQSSQAEERQEPSSRVSLPSSGASCVPAGVNRRAFNPLRKRSKSDSVLLHCQLPQGTVLNCEAATLDVNPLNAVTLRKSSRANALRGRPQSLIDYKSYMDTKQRVAWILEQSCGMSPDIHDLVENIKSVLKSDEKHMAEAVTSATFLEQVMTCAQQATPLSVRRVLPFRLHPGLLHLESCGDLSTFTTEGEQLAERRIQRVEHERPHSLIGVVRETVL